MKVLIISFSLSLLFALLLGGFNGVFKNKKDKKSWRDALIVIAIVFVSIYSFCIIVDTVSSRKNNNACNENKDLVLKEEKCYIKIHDNSYIPYDTKITHF